MSGMKIVVSRYNSKPRAGGGDGKNYRAMAEFRHHLRQFLHFSEKVARRAGMQPQQYLLLLAIKGMAEEQRANIRFLAERLQIEHHSAVELIDRTEEHGFVARAYDASDRRSVLVHLTPKGEKLLGKLAAEHRAELRSLAPALVKALQELTQGKKAIHD